MPTLNLNTSPYFDDYQQQLVDGKDYVRVLFRPGFAVQARELTQLQSMMQEQVTRFGDHIFRDGSIVTNGEVKFINNYDSILINVPTGRAIADYDGRVLTGEITGVRARVISTDGVNRLFLRYLSEGSVVTTGNVGTTLYTAGDTLDKFIFSDVAGANFVEELIVTVADNPGQTESFAATLSGVAFGSAVSIIEGVYYVDGIFTRVQAQTLVLDLNNALPSFRVGFELQSSVVTSNEDPTLVDNSRGTTNTGAPGSNRLENRLLLAKRDLNASPDEIFIEVVRIVDGVVQNVLNNPQYADLLKTFARRTFDESGNYALDPFTPSIEDANTGTTLFVASLAPSKAYVQGYEIETVANTNIAISRARDTVAVENFKQPLPVGNYLDISGTLESELDNLPFGNDNTEKLYLRTNDNQTRGYAHIRGYDNTTPSTNDRIYVYDVRLFVRVPTTGDATRFITGDVITTQRGITGTVAQLDAITDDLGAPTDRANNIYLVNVSGTILSGDTLTSQVNSITDTASSSAIVYKFADEDDDESIKVVSTQDRDLFRATIMFTGGVALQGTQSGLIYDLQREVQTANEGGVANDFLVMGENAISPNQVVSNFNSGPINVYRVDEQDAIRKEITYGTQIHSIIRDTGARTGTRYVPSRPGVIPTPIDITTNIGYGWATSDRELSLQFPDAYRVYAIYDSLDMEVSPVADRLTFATTIPASPFDNGDIITGDTSGAEAFVIRENSTGTGTSGIETTTGSNNVLEILVTRGTFSPNETITSGDKSALLANNHFTATSHVNIAGSYNLDDGQRLDYYDIARLVRKTGAPRPQGQVMVVLARWALGDGEPSVGDRLSAHYYNVDSYPADDESFFELDPQFDPRFADLARPLARINGTNLRNTIDFRRRVRSNRIATGASAWVTNPFSFANRVFVGQSYVVPGNIFNIDFSYFLPRRDKIILNQVGQFVNIAGVSAELPSFPDSPENVMTLNTIDIPAYTRYVEDVTITTINNRRYTMSDIGDLDSRLRNVETAISLTALESNVFNADITDDMNRQRFKSGFVTDDFVNTQQTSGDFTNVEFNVAYDTDQGLMQPALTEQMFRMRERNPNPASRANQHYTVVGGLAMLPYEEVEETIQDYATECLKINPHAVWIFGGDITLTPSSDFWDTITYADPIVQSYQDANGVTINGPFDLDEVPAAVRQSVVTGRTIGTTGSTTSGTTRRTIGVRTFVQRPGRFVNTFRTTTTQITNTVRQASTKDLTSSRVVGDRVITPRASLGEDSFIRPQNVMFSAIDFKPNSEHSIFFDGQDISTRVGDATARSTDIDGTLSGSFSINMLPEDRRGTEAFRFKTGVRRFSLRNNNGTSSGDTIFTATHFLTERQNDIVSTRTVVPAGRILSSSSSNTANTALISSRFIPPPPPPPPQPQPDDNDQGGDGGDGGDGDPIAQSFFVAHDMFVTSIDIRFCVIDMASPNHIELEIRNMVNGYPGTMIVPGGRVSRSLTELASATTNVNPADPASTELGDITTASRTTKIMFKNPVFLEGGGRDYCFVLKTPSPLTSVWTAIRGQVDVRTGAVVDDQPYLGSAFVSQNNITWNAEQNRDITFRIRRADFDVSRTGTLTLEDDTTEINTMYNIGANLARPGLVIETDQGSRYVTIIHPSHGMYDTGRHTVELSGVKGDNARLFNGVPIDKINSNPNVIGGTITHAVLRPTLDTYQVLIESDATFTGATATGCGGGRTVQATQNWQYDKLTTAVQTMTPYGVSLETSIKATTGTSVWLALNSQDNTIENAASTTASGTSTNEELQPSFIEDQEDILITLGETEEFSSPRLLTNSLNDGAASSLSIRMVLSALTQTSFNNQLRSRISPVIDLASNNGLYGLASIVDNNARDTATGLTTEMIEGQPNVVTGGTNTVTPGATPPSVILGMNHSHRSISDTQLEVLAAALDSDPDKISFYKQAVFSNLERTAYVTKEITLENEADRITVVFDVDAEPGNDIRVWVKSSGVEDDTPLSELAWVELSNPAEFIRGNGRLPINNDNDELSSAEDFREFTFDSGDDGFPSFNAFAIRVTIDIENEAEPPRFQNFRAIATA